MNSTDNSSRFTLSEIPAGSEEMVPARAEASSTPDRNTLVKNRMALELWKQGFSTDAIARILHFRQEE
ncbi:MAG: hypothetical protein A2511_09050 [Deltaproteobacteria bacterium RIFOXYD12_FULL_50_9]|nr:MAG: hypothetical protein A2511_09050 [Deltaproteobacteria bacterium RIFOXYD12_FULL_50_9]